MKTVLLGQFRTKALRAGWAVVEIEVRKHDDDQFTSEFAARLRTVLFELSPRERWSEKLREAAAVVKSFSLTVDPSGKVTAGLDVDAASGHADHGNLTLDMTDVFVAIGEAAQSEGYGVGNRPIQSWSAGRIALMAATSPSGSHRTSHSSSRMTREMARTPPLNMRR